MTLEELMNRTRPVLDGLPEWLALEVANTDRAYLKDKFNRWIDEVKSIQQATKRVEAEE